LTRKTDIRTEGFSPDLTASTLKNLVLKTKILITLFGVIFIGQIIIISSLLGMDHPIVKNIPRQIMILGPLFLLLAACLEAVYLRYLNKQIAGGINSRPLFSYIIAFTEISFPAGVLFIIIRMGDNKLLVPPNEILNSPPFILYFILVVLSSLHLDKKLCTFSGLIAGLQYAVVSIYFKNLYSIDALFIPNIMAKAILIFVCGMVAGFVSEKIKLAMTEALHAQDKLINQLDSMVKEKTKEVMAQKAEIELQHYELSEKNKEIVDSIKYAKRIQQALMPSDKYFTKHIKRTKH
jgi:adenylate cyclase